MNRQKTTPATNQPALPSTVTNFNNQRNRNLNPRPRQQTLWGFIRNQLIPHRAPREQHNPEPTITHNPTQDTINSEETPNSTPIPKPTTQTQSTTTATRQTHQRPLQPERSNVPWGDCWAFNQPTSLFRVISKNTGTINLQNMDMKAITKELLLHSASVFAAQETNVNWNEDATHLLKTQCRSIVQQIQIATSTSAEKTKEWYKPGGTITMALNSWTSRVVTKGHDDYLGRWSYLEFVGKHGKRVIVMSSYRVCNQQFDAATQTVTAQQIRLLQANGNPKPKPRKTFLDDLIQQIQKWRRDHKELIICMDANDPVDDPRADIARLFRETDMIDLHYHQHPGHRKPATQQRGSQAIDLIAGSPKAAEAMVHAWICPFGDPAMIKGDH